MEWFDVLILALTFASLLAIGVPIAYSIGIATVVTMLAGIQVVPSLTTASQRMATGLNSFALLAIPFFILGRPVNEPGRAGSKANRLCKVPCWVRCPADLRT